MEDEDRNISVEPTKDNIEKLLSREKINEVLGSDKGIKLLSIFGFDELDLYIKQQGSVGQIGARCEKRYCYDNPKCR